MLKKTITFEDLDGNSVTEDFYFHLTKAEIAKLELSYEGGLSGRLAEIIAEGDGATIIQTFEDILKTAYGVRGPDGRQFIKSDELWLAFKQSDAYSELFLELVTKAEASADFIKGIMPAKLVAEATEKLAAGAPELGPLKEKAEQVEEVKAMLESVSVKDNMIKELRAKGMDEASIELLTAHL